MRFDAIRVRNMGALRSVDLDLASIPGPLVAVAGENGSGKSTLLGLLHGAIYREAPTRGSLVDLAQGRDAQLEVRAVNGAPWTFRHLVDGVARKSEGTVLDADGVPVPECSSAKVKALDAWVAEHMPAPEVALASTFAAQGSGGFLELGPGERKSALLKLLGVEHLEQLAEGARERLRAAKGRAEVLRGKLAEHEDVDVGAAEAALEAARARLLDLEAELATARASVASLDEELVTVRAAWAREQERQRAITDGQKRLDAACARVADLETRIANNRRVLAQEVEIRAAAARVAELDAVIAAATAEHEAKASAFADVSLESKVEGRAAAAEQRKASAMRRIEAARARTRDRGDIEIAKACLPNLRHAEEVAARAVTEIEGKLEEARAERIAGAGERIESLRGGLTEVVERLKDPSRGVATPGIIALDTLRADDAAARAATEIPATVTRLERELAEARRTVVDAGRKLAEATALAAREGEIAAADADVLAAQADVDAATEELATLAADLEAERERGRQLGAEAKAASDRVKAAKAERAPLLDAAGRLQLLEAAAARVAELEHSLGVATTDVRELARTLKDLDESVVRGSEPQPPDELERMRANVVRCVASIEPQVRAAAGEVAVAMREAARAQHVTARAAELRAELAGVDEQLADWARLAEDLGKDGLQAAEVDAAGPELTTLVNDLLHTCHGSRFTVTIETQRASADGRKTIEGCEVRVLDTERGRDAVAETLSGGERVIVSEAISLALSMLACRRSGLQGVTLVRDESGAALDPVNARAWIAMLRRAAELVGARQVLFVSHSVETQEMADSRIVVADGTARVA